MTGQKHKTQDGVTLLVAEMTTEHIQNYIVWKLETVHEQPEIDNKTAIMYGLKNKTKENNYEAQKNVIEHLFPYFSELLFRDAKLAPNAKAMLDIMLNRKNRLTIIGKNLPFKLENGFIDKQISDF